MVRRENLAEATEKFARRLALIAPEALAATKLAINRGADAAGFRNAMQAGIDVVAPLYAATTEVGAEFRTRTKADGLPAALKWRNYAFVAKREPVLQLNVVNIQSIGDCGFQILRMIEIGLKRQL